jgi:hypothetical protein
VNGICCPSTQTVRALFGLGGIGFAFALWRALLRAIGRMRGYCLVSYSANLQIYWRKICAVKKNFLPLHRNSEIAFALPFFAL